MKVSKETYGRFNENTYIIYVLVSFVSTECLYPGELRAAVVKTDDRAIKRQARNVTPS